MLCGEAFPEFEWGQRGFAHSDAAGQARATMRDLVFDAHGKRGHGARSPPKRVKQLHALPANAGWKEIRKSAGVSSAGVGWPAFDGYTSSLGAVLHG